MSRRGSAAARQPRPTFVLILEGEMTEKAYFLHLGQLLRIRVVTLATRDGKSAPKHLVRRTAAAQKEYGGDPRTEIWIVADHDGRPDPELQTLYDTNARVALSVPCFEAWLLAHFPQFRRCNHADEYRRQLARVDGPFDKRLPRVRNWLTATTVVDAVRRMRATTAYTGNRPWPDHGGSAVPDLIERMLAAAPQP